MPASINAFFLNGQKWSFILAPNHGWPLDLGSGYCWRLVLIIMLNEILVWLAPRGQRVILQGGSDAAQEYICNLQLKRVQIYTGLKLLQPMYIHMWFFFFFWGGGVDYSFIWEGQTWTQMARPCLVAQYDRDIIYAGAHKANEDWINYKRRRWLVFKVDLRTKPALKGHICARS